MRFIGGKIKQAGLILAWGLYDLANQSFSVNIVSLYFVRWLTLEKGSHEVFYSISFGISTFFIAILAPVLGIISDETQRRRPFLVFLTFIAIIFTFGLGFCKSAFLGLLFFAVANFGCQSAVVFYNAQMVDVAPAGKIGLISGFGRMLGYSGAIVALLVIKPIVLERGFQATFIPTAILFLLFSLPCMIFLKDRVSKEKIKLSSYLNKEKIIRVFRSLRMAAAQARKIPGLLDFLKVCFFGLCGVNVVILFMSVYATKVFGLDEVQIINIVMVSTFFAIASSLFSGFISDYIGNKRSFILVLALWSACFICGAFVKDGRLYWIIGALVGSALGAIWSVCRSYAIELVPPEKIGEVFGLFNLVGYLSAIAGAVFWGVVLVLLSGLGEIRYRIALLSLVVFMALGLVFLLRIPDKIYEKG